MSKQMPPVLFGLVLLLFLLSTAQTVRTHPVTNTPKKKGSGSLASKVPFSSPMITFPVQKSVSKQRLPHSLGFPTATPIPKLTRAVTPGISVTPSVTGTPSPVKKTQMRLMPLGDSITYGSMAIGGYRTDLWSALVQVNGANIDFVGSQASGPPSLGDLDNEGHIGWTMAQIDTYAFNWMRLYQPDIVLLHVGTNDLRLGASSATMTQDLIKLIGDLYAGKPDTYIIVSTLIPTTQGDQGTWGTFNAAIPGIAATYQGQGRRISVVDMSHALTLNDLVDGIHPNSIGNSKMASVWYSVVFPYYQQQSGRR